MLEEIAKLFDRRATRPTVENPQDMDTEEKRLELAFRMGRHSIIQEVVSAIRNSSCPNAHSKNDSREATEIVRD